jgi:hypothetical protein
MHALDGAYKRFGRANEHINDLHRRIGTLLGHEFNRVVKEPQLIGPPERISWDGPCLIFRCPPKVLPATYSIIVGEIVYNLRAALDYLVYELACFDSKQDVEGTQFPIEDSEIQFNKRIGSIAGKGRGVYLRGVSPEHIAAIKRLQPFNGCEWTERLRFISNPDKHRRLTLLDHSISVIVQVTSTETSVVKNPMNVNHTKAVDIVFKDGTPVIETLEQLMLKVRQTIDSFKPEFERG